MPSHSYFYVHTHPPIHPPAHTNTHTHTPLALALVSELGGVAEALEWEEEGACEEELPVSPGWVIEPAEPVTGS
jgi:hypothetical protein